MRFLLVTTNSRHVLATAVHSIARQRKFFRVYRTFIVFSEGCTVRAVRLGGLHQGHVGGSTALLARVGTPIRRRTDRAARRLESLTLSSSRCCGTSRIEWTTSSPSKSSTATSGDSARSPPERWTRRPAGSGRRWSATAASPFTCCASPAAASSYGSSSPSPSPSAPAPTRRPQPHRLLRSRAHARDAVRDAHRASCHHARRPAASASAFRESSQANEPDASRDRRCTATDGRAETALARALDVGRLGDPRRASSRGVPRRPRQCRASRAVGGPWLVLSHTRKPPSS